MMRSKTASGSDFDLYKEASGPEKSGFRVRRPTNFKVSHFLARVACGGRFGTLLASFWGAFWPSGWLKPLLKFLLGRPRAVEEDLFSAREASKSAPRG